MPDAVKVARPVWSGGKTVRSYLSLPRQVLKGFRAELASATESEAEVLRTDALRAIAGERVGERPDRYEPRARKRREKMYPRLQIPRRLARKPLETAS